MAINTFNKFAVGVLGGENIVILNAPRSNEIITKNDALLLAATLVALAEPDEGEDRPKFADYLNAILAC